MLMIGDGKRSKAKCCCSCDLMWPNLGHPTFSCSLHLHISHNDVYHNVLCQVSYVLHNMWLDVVMILTWPLLLLLPHQPIVVHSFTTFMPGDMGLVGDVYNGVMHCDASCMSIAHQ